MLIIHHKIAAETVVQSKKMHINMAALSFIYRDSLPVAVEKGNLDIRSKTLIVDGDIDSKNSLSLKQQRIAAKRGVQLTVGMIPASVLVDALNKVDPLDLKFNITGTVDDPKFGGFQDSLMKVIKPYLADIKEQGVSAVKSFIKSKI